MGVPIDKYLVKFENEYSAPVQSAVNNYLYVRRIAHSSGLKCYAADNAIRQLGDSPFCCGQELLPRFSIKAVHAHNITAIGFRSQIVEPPSLSGGYSADNMPILGVNKRHLAHSLSQDSSCTYYEKTLSHLEIIRAGFNAFNMRRALPFATRIDDLVYKQSDVWWDFVLYTRNAP